MNKKNYPRYAKEQATKTNTKQNCICAFLVGGTICFIGQCLFSLYAYLGLKEDSVKILVPCTLIAITAILTGIGIFDRIAKHAGAGTLVPITGFANAVVSPAIDTTAEGLVLGLGVKIFTIAGPVILYGTCASVLYGILYFIFGR